LAAAAALPPAATATPTKAKSSLPLSWTTTTASSVSSGTIRRCNGTSVHWAREAAAGGQRPAGAVLAEGKVLTPKIAGVRMLATPADGAKEVATLARTDEMVARPL
jgi:hypothetical protein